MQVATLQGTFDLPPLVCCVSTDECGTIPFIVVDIFSPDVYDVGSGSS
jgi:hypothetical protein